MIPLKSLPNFLSYIRVAAAPLLVACALVLPDAWKDPALFTLFLLAALTDFLDGQLARHFNLSTKWGEFIDPVADKILVIVTLLILLHEERAHFIPVVIIVCREICMSALREWMANLGMRRVVAVAFIGKIKMACQAIAILLLLYRTEYFGYDSQLVGNIALWVAALLTIVSMFLYLKSAIELSDSHDSSD